MSETKFTPGPWKAREIAPDDPEEEGPQGPVSTMVLGAANARLIACEEEFTSPDTETGEARDGDDESVFAGKDQVLSPLTFGVIRRARTALSQARGEGE